MQLCSAAICCNKVQHVTQLAVTLKLFLIYMDLTIRTMHIDHRITAAAPTTMSTIITSVFRLPQLGHIPTRLPCFTHMS